MMTRRQPPPPFIIRRDGTLVDRESGEAFGRVWVSGSGIYGSAWRARIGEPLEGPLFRGTSRGDAASQAWSAWRFPDGKDAS